MQATGIVRKMDDLGRITLPIELRRMYGIDIKDPMEILADDGLIILRKYEPQMTCAITGEVSADNESFADGKLILSQACIEQLKKELGS